MELQKKLARMSWLSLGFQALYMTHVWQELTNMTDCAFWYKASVS